MSAGPFLFIDLEHVVALVHDSAETEVLYHSGFAPQSYTWDNLAIPARTPPDWIGREPGSIPVSLPNSDSIRAR